MNAKGIWTSPSLEQGNLSERTREIGVFSSNGGENEPAVKIGIPTVFVRFTFEEGRQK